MSNALAATLILLTLVVLALIFAVIALARQIGILHTRLAPAGALMTTSGPKLGEKITSMSIPDIHGKPVAIGATGNGTSAGKAQLLLFVSPTCPICKELVPTAKSMALSDNVDLIFGSDGGQAETHLQYIEKMKLQNYPYIVSLELGMRFEVGKLPYAVLIDESGALRSKGLVNSREHLESLVTAMQSGYESIQDYLVKEGQLEGSAS
ncbi:methylamine dehydrogenase accessory protein MauD [Pseudohongiella acticola]|jgi:methylamine dehydrogenase accessory protein MauD|uniref:methylamine dehydrogenase accessory protein MauD n=1 Tax=Pseudohongiella acticola TaxID=1524254 RepID=UPI0030EBBCD4